MKRFIQILFLLPLLFVVPLTQTACNKTTLDPQGVYAQPGAGGVVVYDLDLSIATSKNVIEGFLTWEKANRALIEPKYPQIRGYADQLRQNAPKWLQSAVALRDAYAANPTSANKTAFDTAMAVLDAAVTQAQAYLATAVKPK